MSVVPIISESLDILGKILDVILSHPLLTWVFLIFLLSVDAGISSVINFGGILGTIFSAVFSFLFKRMVIVNSFQILVIIVILPLVVIAINKSRQLQKA